MTNIIKPVRLRVQAIRRIPDDRTQKIGGANSYRHQLAYAEDAVYVNCQRLEEHLRLIYRLYGYREYVLNIEIQAGD